MRFCLESRTIAELKVNVAVHEQKKSIHMQKSSDRIGQEAHKIISSAM